MNRGERGEILVADDNPSNLELARDALDASGYTVRVAMDGAAALESARARMPDAVLMDVHMPRMDGYEACAAIRADAALRFLPVIFLSGMDEAFNKARAFEVGGSDYVVKPFDRTELLARVANQVELSRSRRALEEEARRLGAALADLTIARNELADVGKRELLLGLSGGLAHELNNPLNIILVGASALRRAIDELLSIAGASDRDGRAEALKVEIRDLLDGVNEGAERAALIVGKLRSLASPAEAARKSADVARLARRAADLARLRARGRAALELDIRARPVSVCAPDRLAQLFYELIVNAVDFSPEGGKVLAILDLAPGASGEAFAFEVRDEGPGVPEDLREKIFEPFFTTKPAGKGTGLGLAIAREAAREHGGRLIARYPDGGGAIFTALLPIIVLESHGLDDSLEEVDP